MDNERKMKTPIQREFTIQKRKVGPSRPPFIIAEMSGNHQGSLQRALDIVDAAAAAGADALKIQTYTADTMTLNLNKREFLIRDPKSLWKGQSLYALYQKAFTPWEWHPAIFKRCRERGIIGFSTPFDVAAVNALQSLHVPVFKIASFENIDLPLIRRVATTGKPMIISTGMATVAELEEAVHTARQAGCRDVILLKCTSVYPSSPTESHLNTIPHMRDLFRCQVGLSDHTLGVGASIAAVALGATMIERHITLSRRDGGPDAAFSLEPDELKTLVTETRIAWQAMGNVHYGPTPHERSSLLFRRSLYIAKDMKAGDVLTKKNLRSIRPGLGLHPRYYALLLGRKIKRNAKKGTPAQWNLI